MASSIHAVVHPDPNTNQSSASNSPGSSTGSVSPALSHRSSHTSVDEKEEKRSYSCKRCRRLKKKCSRTKPECFNCGKAGEICEYVPRAPRRKKSEIMRNLDDDKSDEPVKQYPLPRSPLGQMVPQHLHIHQPHMPPETHQLPSVSHLTAFDIPSRRVTHFSTFDQQKPSLPPLSSLNAQFQQQPPPPQRYYQPPPPTVLHHYPHPQPPQMVHQPPPQPQAPPIQQPTPAPQQTPQPLVQSKPLPAAEIAHGYLTSILNSSAQPLKTPQPQIAAPNLTNDMLTRCVDQFFEDYGKTYPFLSHSEFIRKHNPLAHSFRDGTSFEMNMAIMMGYTALSKVRKVPEDAELRETLRQWALGDVSTLVGDESVATLRKLLFYGMYTLMNTTGDASWYISGLLTRMAISLGLNRAVKSVNEKEREECHRVFWSVYNFDRAVSFALGRPASMMDDDVDVPVLRSRPDEDADLVELLKAVSKLRKVEGMIVREVHSIGKAAVGGGVKPSRVAEETLQKMRLEIEAWYNATSMITCADRKVSLASCTTSWYSAIYYQLLSLLYRPSYLAPSHTKETLTLLGRCVLQSVSFTYNLHTIHQLPLHWAQLNRLLTLFTTLIFCLCHSCVDLVETKAEVNLCMELLEHFSGEWDIARQILEVFRKVNVKVYDLRMEQQNGGQVVDFGKNFKAIGSEYCDILVKSGYDLKYDGPVIEAIRAV